MTPDEAQGPPESAEPPQTSRGLFRTSLAGRYAMAHFLMGIVALLGVRGVDSEWLLMIYGSPLIWGSWLVGEVYGAPLPPIVAAGLVVSLWVGNSLLWGWFAGIVHRKLATRTQANP